MTKREGIEIITELEAAEKLTARGYKQKECKTCKGNGYVSPSPNTGYACPTCEGAGWVWQEPPAK